MVFDEKSVTIQIYAPISNMLFLSSHFQFFFLVFNFQNFDHDVNKHGLLCVYSIWFIQITQSKGLLLYPNLRSFLPLFLQIFFYIFCILFSFPSGPPMIYIYIRSFGMFPQIFELLDSFFIL